MPSLKNILLVNPWIHDFTAHDFWMRPLGLLCVAGVLRRAGCFRLDFIDCLDRRHPKLPVKLRTAEDGRGPFFKQRIAKPSVLRHIPRRYSRYGIPPDLFRDELRRLPVPDAVLVTGTMTYWYPGVQEAIECLRDVWGGVPVILGGIYATLLPDHARRHSGADVVVEGPGERSILSVLKEVMGASLPVAEEGNDPAVFPPPAHDFLGGTDVLAVLSSRGCPFRCSFCAAPLLFDGFVRRDPEAVVAEITRHHRRLRTRHFAFYDDALLVGKKDHALPLLRRLAREALPVALHFPNGLHVREIDEETSLWLKRANAVSVFLSQETFDRNRLESSCPKVGSGDLERAVRFLEKAGFDRARLNVYLLIGLPGQDGRSAREDIERVLAMGARPRLAYFSPVPGTLEWKTLVEKGFLSASADPLLHNKLVFPFTGGSMGPEEFETIRRLALARPDRSSLPGRV